MKSQFLGEKGWNIFVRKILTGSTFEVYPEVCIPITLCSWGLSEISKMKQVSCKLVPNWKLD